jgi:hypothetical protein
MGMQQLGRRLPHDDKGRAARASAFVNAVFSVLKDIEYRRCDSGEDMEDIYRLRYNSYLAAGMIRANESRKIQDDLDDSPNSYRFGVYYDGNLVSTLRLHYISAQYPDAPSVRVFKDVLIPRLEAGETFIDPSRFAADGQWAATLRVLPYVTLRLAMVARHYFNPTAILTAIKEEHAGFYKRVFESEAVVEGRTYPGLTMPVFLYQSRCPEPLASVEARYPFFASSPIERRLLFDRSGPAKFALTVLPTVKYSQAAA